MAIRVAINGFGRIGRCFLRAAFTDKEVEIVAINDLGEPKNLAYLLQYDSAQGTLPFTVTTSEGAIVVGGKSIVLVQEKDPTKLPWKELNIDVVVESTGVYNDFEKAQVHIAAGAKRVVVSAPAKGEGSTVLMGINEESLSTCQVSSNASCTTNAASPLIAILSETIGIEKALLNTTHATTASQRTVDGTSPKDLREGRAAGVNIIPASTGAAIAVTKVLPELIGKFDGISMRVPVVDGSIVDVTFLAKRDTTAEEVNTILEQAAATPRWQGIFGTTREPLVSSDIVGSHLASLADLQMTRVVGGNLVKVLAWYDNEMGYTYTLLRHVKTAAGVK